MEVGQDRFKCRALVLAMLTFRVLLLPDVIRISLPCTALLSRHPVICDIDCWGGCAKLITGCTWLVN
jgi:hypothetical protein